MKQSSILVYSEKSSKRLEYSFRLILCRVLGAIVEFSYADSVCKNYPGPVINYSSNDLPGAIQIVPHGLLFETGIREQSFTSSLWKGQPFFCQTEKNGDFPFDIFSAAFFLATRYEEYLPFEPDKHGRFKAEDSFAFRNGFLQLPVINLWALELKKIINEKYPDYLFPEFNYRFIPTIDVDVAMAYKHRGFWRTLGAFMKTFSRWNNQQKFQRFKAIAGIQKDPFDTYEDFDAIHEKYNLIATYFFAVGDKGPFDKNLHFKNKSFQKIIRQLSCRNNTGLHPSYDSWKNKYTVEKEKIRLEKIVRRKVTASRQHYLRISFPETYRLLIETGITKDFTMGFASRPGFRAGICSPFHFYDLLKETETELEIWPFQVMDGTLNHYMKLNPEGAIKTISEMITAVKKVDGTFISLWHNDALSETNEWTGWEKIYEELVKMASGQ